GAEESGEPDTGELPPHGDREQERQRREKPGRGAPPRSARFDARAREEVIGPFDEGASGGMRGASPEEARKNRRRDEAERHFPGPTRLREPLLRRPDRERIGAESGVIDENGIEEEPFHPRFASLPRHSFPMWVHARLLSRCALPAHRRRRSCGTRLRRFDRDFPRTPVHLLAAR